MLASSDIENILGSLTPRVEESVAALVDMTPSEWRKQSREKKAKQLVDFQNRGLLAATLASAAKAQTDLEEAAFAVTQASEAKSLTEDVEALKEMVADLTAKAKHGKKDAHVRG